MEERKEFMCNFTKILLWLRVTSDYPHMDQSHAILAEASPT
jgi:hypothetical protein